MTTLLAPNALTNLATAKGELGLTDTSFDDVVSRLINAASDAIEQVCGRKRFPFYQDATTENLSVPVTWPDRLVITRIPVASVTSVSTDLDPGPPTLVPAADYFVEDLSLGFLYSRGRWRTTAIRRPDIVQDYDPGSDEETYQVVYVGGYVTQLQVDGYNAPAWPGSTQSVAVRALVKPAGRPTQVWACTTAGTTGTPEPTWPATPVVGQTIADGGAIWTYTAWVPALGRTEPGDLEQACLDLVTTRYRRRGQDLDIKSEGLLGASITYGDRLSIPKAILDALQPYRRMECA